MKPTVPSDKDPAKKKVRAPRAPRVGGPAKGAGNGNPRKDLQPGHALSLKHGGKSMQLRERYPDECAAADAVVAEAVEGLPAASPAFAIQRGILAERLVRYQRVTTWIDDNGGEIDPATADAKGAAKLAERLLNAIEKTLTDLGLSPRSAAAMYGDLAKALPLHEHPDAIAATRRLAELDALDAGDAA